MRVDGGHSSTAVSLNYVHASYEVPKTIEPSPCAHEYVAYSIPDTVYQVPGIALAVYERISINFESSKPPVNESHYLHVCVGIFTAAVNPLKRLLLLTVVHVNGVPINENTTTPGLCVVYVGHTPAWYRC